MLLNHRTINWTCSTKSSFLRTFTNLQSSTAPGAVSQAGKELLEEEHQLKLRNRS